MDNNKKNKAWWEPALLIFAKFSIWIAVPIICALFIGKYFDEKYGTDPFIFLGLTAVAFIISLFGIWKILKKYINEIEKEKNGKSN